MSMFIFCRTAVKNFGMERVKKNWSNVSNHSFIFFNAWLFFYTLQFQASKGFDHVLHHFQTLKHQGRVQSYLKEGIALDYRSLHFSLLLVVEKSNMNNYESTFQFIKENGTK